MRRSLNPLIPRWALLLALGIVWPFFLFGRFGKPSVDDGGIEKRIGTVQAREPTLTPEEAAMLER